MTQETPLQKQPQRESIWAVDPKWRNAYFAIFTGLSTISITRVIWYEITHSPYENRSLTIDAIMGSIGRNCLGAAGLAITLTELGRFSMVLGGALEDALRKRRRTQIDEARTEALVKANNLVQAWNRRRLSALENGDPFDEPPPDVTAPPDNGR